MEIEVNLHEQRHSYQIRLALENFWTRANRARAGTRLGRLALLRLMVETTLAPDPFKAIVTTSHRRQHFQRRKLRGHFKMRGCCWVCVSKSPEHRHHIIPLNRGGSSIRKNVVVLCRACHLAVHEKVSGCLQKKKE